MHRPIANVKVNDAYLSALTAEYPVSLAKQLAALMAPFCSSLGHKRVPLSHFSNLLPEPVVHRRPLVCDGAGVNSSADSSNASAAPSPLQDVITHWLQFAAQRNLTQSIVSHLCQARDAHPLTEAQQLEVAAIAHSFLHPQCKDPACLQITPGQPFRLKLLQAFASRTKDPDRRLHSFLAEGVPAGILQDIPSSFQWQQRQQTLQEDDLDGLHLLHCQGNWTQAEQNPELLRQLLQKEVDNGWVIPFHGNASDAARQWPEGTAIGKLNIVSAEGKDPRLVLDSTICNANPLCKVPERVSLPAALDVQRTFLQGDRRGNFIGMSLDFKAAHKCVKVHRREQGCLLFRVDSQLYHYTVCHFGAKFSAYWWQRVGGQLLRIAHALLQQHGHNAWLYVDDLLAMLAQATWQQQAVLLTFFISAINAPISWKKAQLGHRITWCGWTFHLDIEALHLVECKLAKLRDQLDKLAKSKKILRKHLESSLGLLMWATSTCPHLRPYLAPLYKDLRSGQGTLHQVFARDWQRFVDSLTPEAVVAHQPAGLWITAGSKLLEVGSVSVQSKQDVPRIPPSHKPQWVRLSDPARTEIHLHRNESRQALLWLSACFQHDQLRTLRQSPLLHCMAAADAMAEGDAVGIGGWISTSTEFLWFSESWSMTEIRRRWPQLTKSAQPYIACFETLAQLALAMLARRRLHSRHFNFVLPTASDNTAAEAGINKLFTATEPLCTFLKLVACWSARRNVHLAVSHLAGEKNVWADELSRSKLQRFARRSADRERIPLDMLARPQGIVALYPPHAAWPQPLLDAQH